MLYFLAASIFFAQVDQDRAKEITRIDQKIEQLQQLKENYNSRAKRGADNAMRWQFQKENYTDARRAWDQAQRDQQKVQEIQDRIDDLKAQKQNLTKEYETTTP